MIKSKGNIACSIWRSFEILLFFVISVVGFNVLLKTTSQNSRSKEKSLTEKTAAHCELSGQELMFNGSLVCLQGYLARQHTEAPAHHAVHHQQLTVSRYDTSFDKARIYSYLPALQPANLLQQNPILLI
jgi:hypothetical protein